MATVAEAAVDPAKAEAGGMLAEFAKLQQKGVTATPAETPRRVSRRQQQAEIAQQPFVAKAMELFDVPPDGVKYTPPRGGGQGSGGQGSGK